MNETLTQALSQLNLQPGQSERVRVNEYEVEIRRLKEVESDFGDASMLEPWAWFPDLKPIATLPLQHGTLPLPDPPVIPSEEGETA